MTEAEWLACEDPVVMLDFLHNANGRKLRRFAVACCHRIWELLDSPARSLLLLAERHCDGEGAAYVEMNAARQLLPERGGYTPARYSLRAVRAAASHVNERNGAYLPLQAMQAAYAAAYCL